MKDRYLEVSFRQGRPFAAYLYLPRNTEDRSARVELRAGGLLIDRTNDGRAIGIEIPDPASATLEALNDVLAELSQEPLASGELRPLGAA